MEFLIKISASFLATGITLGVILLGLWVLKKIYSNKNPFQKQDEALKFLTAHYQRPPEISEVEAILKAPQSDWVSVANKNERPPSTRMLS